MLTDGQFPEPINYRWPPAAAEFPPAEPGGSTACMFSDLDRYSYERIEMLEGETFVDYE